MQVGDRQELHERIRVHSQAAALEVKQNGASNDLLDRLAGDPAFQGISVKELADPRAFVGRAPEQVDEFIREVVQPILEASTSNVSHAKAVPAFL